MDERGRKGRRGGRRARVRRKQTQSDVDGLRFLGKMKKKESAFRGPSTSCLHSLLVRFSSQEASCSSSITSIASSWDAAAAVASGEGETFQETRGEPEDLAGISG